MSRLSKGGLIDRNKTLKFRFDGCECAGHPGDTLASALLANGIRLMGRSFKYHRPRGVMTAGSDEPNALMEIGKGANITPNTRATTQELYEGLEARSQNNWPSLAWDAMQINDLAAPLLSAGFYYKTFMWPKKFWEWLYEPVIRRAAGLGRLSGERDPSIYDRGFAHCDILVIGAGPAGLNAALVAGEAGAKVILADEDFLMGGRLLSDPVRIDGQDGAAWAANACATLRDMPNVRLMPRTTVTGAYDGATYGALEQVADHVSSVPENCPRQTFWRIAARRTILCAGALERPIAFPNNDRPGVMMAGAVRSYVHRYGVAPGRKIVVFTNNPSGAETSEVLARAGLDYEMLRPNEQVIATHGHLGLQAVTVRDDAGNTHRIECDTLAISGGWNPNVHLTCHLNGRPEWRDDIAAFVPKPGAVPGMVTAGAVNGDFSTDEALFQGAQAACDAVNALGFNANPVEKFKTNDAKYQILPLWTVKGKGRSWLDFQNDVTVKDVEQAHRENFRSVEHMKRYTTLGMATDQGKGANVNALAVMAELTGQTIPETGTTTFRPPYTPVQIAAYGAGGDGKGFAPIRYIPSHDFCTMRNAPMLEAGLWYRPAYFPRKGEETWRESCDREVDMVRNCVGVTDASSLGKIEISGPDAAQFLDRIYCNTISSLGIGRVRYGLMLREDGFVMDDGTCARLDDARYLVTTTTAAAGRVISHLEFCAQCLWPQMDVAICSVSEQWAQFAITGPKAGALIKDLADVHDLGFMNWCDLAVGGVAGRLFRISFSGELGYEIAVPSRFGAALFEELAGRAEALGGGVYGLEALNVLRIEKGFLTHAEIDGRVSADDLGFGRMVAKKDCIGREMSLRPGLHGETRAQLVGLRPCEPWSVIKGGAHLVNVREEATRENYQGYISSACHSPTLGHHIALALLVNGRARHEERIEVVDFMRGEARVMCEVVAPCFYDEDGGRVRG